ncbi:MAG: NAD+ synthase [Elusimicrobia bacterium]|nr:NAD+ synthase [Elusimicrobiota bacterium]
MKVALAQINTTVGDIRGNLGRIRDAYRRAQGLGAALAVFPELAVAGYPAWDLLDQRDFVKANLQGLKELARETGKTGLVAGFVDINVSKSGKRLHNALALCHQGKVLAIRHKTLLPTYDVFDEARYFEPARENRPISFAGRRWGFSICEDAWNDAGFWKKRLYDKDPIRTQVRSGAGVLVNISASPYHRGKTSLRRRMLCSHARKARAPMLFCNLVGGNDELLFDGNSFALDGRGRMLAHARAFEEDITLVDLDAPLRPVPSPGSEDIEEVYRALLLGLRDYARKCAFKDIVVGLSGGIDSALVAALAAAALGPEHVTGVSMPSMYSSPGSIMDAQKLAHNLGIRLLSIPIIDIYKSYLSALHEVFRATLPGPAEQNIQARIRGNLLMALSNNSGALLLSTGNKSELSVGYCTLYGDMSGGLAVLADVPKTTVYALGRFVNREREIIPQASLTKPPSAELKPNQTDQDDLPPYDVLDDVMRAYIEEGLEAKAIVRRGRPRALVEDILRRIDRNEYKRRQAAPGLRITPKAFGIGRRMPIARGFQQTSGKNLLTKIG